MPSDRASFVLIRNGIVSLSTGENPAIGSFWYVGLLKITNKRRKCLKFYLHNFDKILPIFCHICKHCCYVLNCLKANSRLFIGFIANHFFVKLLCDITSINFFFITKFYKLEKIFKHLLKNTWTDSINHHHVQHQVHWPFELEMVGAIFSTHSISNQLQTCRTKRKR